VKIRVKILSGGVEDKIIEVSEHTTYEGLLELLSINPEIAIVLRHGKPVPLDEEVTLDDVEILRVVSGG